MNPNLPVTALIELVHRYYPAGIDVDDSRYNESEEAQRLSTLLEAAQKDSEAWERFVRRVEESLPECRVRDKVTLPYAPGRQCEVVLPGASPGEVKEENAVVCILSVLAPVYAIYATHQRQTALERESWRRFPPLPPEFGPHEAKLAGLVESHFGFTRLPNEVLFTPVPDLRVGLFGKRGPRLLECLFF